MEMLKILKNNLNIFYKYRFCHETENDNFLLLPANNIENIFVNKLLFFNNTKFENQQKKSKKDKEKRRSKKKLSSYYL